MQYRQDKYGNRISILGYGCMRFTKTAGKIDLEKAEKEILHAYRLGINYYDTAYIYPGSEACIGTIFEKHNIREKIYIATKLPHYLIKSKKQAEQLLQEELSRLKTDYIDYYLMHMLTDVKTWERLVELGIKDLLEEKKANGTIKQIGFSYHGNADTFCELLDVYDWDFCQIQYNYLDEHSQAGRKGLNYAASKKIPVIIMEPLRGGKLVHGLPDKAKQLFENYKTKRTAAAWAFSWLWDQKEVTCILSGMNSIEMIEENATTASSIQPNFLTDEDQQLLKEVVACINEKTKVGCTGCGYCMPCPKKVDIPGTFSAYNKYYADSAYTGMFEYMQCTVLRKDSTSASNCVECGLCEKHCPQHIPIRQELKNAKKVLENPIYHIAKKILSIVLKY